jgi:hypothetical protein
MKPFNGVKVFSATMVRDREQLGEKVTQWLASHPSYQLADYIVTQSSDSRFHCVALVLFFYDETAVSERPRDGGGKSVPATGRLHRVPAVSR